MRKFVLVAAAAGAALTLGACSEGTTDAVEATADSAMADAEANVEAVEGAVEGAVEAAEEVAAPAEEAAAE